MKQAAWQRAREGWTWWALIDTGGNLLGTGPTRASMRELRKRKGDGARIVLVHITWTGSE